MVKGPGAAPARDQGLGGRGQADHEPGYIGALHNYQEAEDYSNYMQCCWYTRDYANMLRKKVLQLEPIKRFLMSRAKEEIYRYRKHLDPAFKGVNLKVLEAFQKTKSEISLGALGQS